MSNSNITEIISALNITAKSSKRVYNPTEQLALIVLEPLLEIIGERICVIIDIVIEKTKE